MFRYVLAGSERGLVPLEEELAFVDSYLEIERARDEVVIAIADHGPGFEQESRGAGGLRRGSPLLSRSPAPPLSSGHGLSNVDERLRKTYGEGYGLEIRDNEPQGTVVTVRIPIRVGSADRLKV